MSTQHRVAWIEGMFIRPQHFQQQENYFDYLVTQRLNALTAYTWGFLDYKLDESLLEIGRIALVQARGILPDGTPFDMPAVDELPPAISIDPHTKNQLIHLALPLKQDGVCQVTAEPGSNVRYRSHEYHLADITSVNLTTSPVQLAKLNFQFYLQVPDHRPLIYLPIARIQEVTAEGKIILDREFVPPCLDYRASLKLIEIMHEILAMLRHRSEILVQRMGDIHRSTSALLDWLMLQVINRFEPLFRHAQQRQMMHPEQFFYLLLQLTAELTTFNPSEQRLLVVPSYLHQDLQQTFQPLMSVLRRAISVVMEQAAISLPLEERKYGILVASVTDKSLLEESSLVLTITSALPAETILARIPAQVKIGSVEGIRQLITAQLSGIKLQALPVTPPQIPYHLGSCCFKLQLTPGELTQLKDSGGLAIHISGEFPELKIQLWAIRENGI